MKRRAHRLKVHLFCLAVVGVNIPAVSHAEPPAPTAADFPRVPIGMSNMIVRLDRGDTIGLAGQNLRVQVLEHLRAKGVTAVGAENLVFEKDDTKKARFMLGGTINEVACHAPDGALVNCRMGIEWQVLDVATDTVVYRVTTRSATFRILPTEKDVITRTLVLGAVDSLLRRPNFRQALAAGVGSAPVAADAAQPSAGFAACSAQPSKMPEGAETLLSGAVLVRTPTGFGSGFFLTTDGLVLTAAHVVETGPLKIRLKDGAEVDAVVVRSAPKADVALLRPAMPMVGQRCLPLATSEPPVGADAFVAGAPGAAVLAFSLTRGIISGVRQLDGQPQLQTDAPVSPGNSGGPLANSTGAVAAVIVSKLTGGRVEGVSFAVPVKHALSALGLTPAAKTDAALLSGSLQTPKASAAAALVDEPDAVPSLDPEGDARRLAARQQKERDDAEARRQRERDAATPFRAKALVGGGIVVAIFGAYAIYDGWNSNSDTTTRAEFKKYRIENTLGWVGVAAGAGMVVWGRSMYPDLKTGGLQRVDVVATPSKLSLRGSF